jgi:hypothetical protein
MPDTNTPPIQLSPLGQRELQTALVRGMSTSRTDPTQAHFLDLANSLSQILMTDHQRQTGQNLAPATPTMAQRLVAKGTPTIQTGVNIPALPATSMYNKADFATKASGSSTSTSARSALDLIRSRRCTGASKLSPSCRLFQEQERDANQARWEELGFAGRYPGYDDYDSQSEYGSWNWQG